MPIPPPSLDASRLTDPKPPAPPASTPGQASSSPPPSSAAAPGKVAGSTAGGATPEPGPRIFSKDAPYEPPPRPKTRWFGFSTVVLLVIAAAAYYKYQDYLDNPPPPPPKPAVELKEVPASANPLTALKQAKAVIKDAGDKHKAAYNTVGAMLDGTDPARPTQGTTASAAPVAAPVPAPETAEAPATPTTRPAHPASAPATTAAAPPRVPPLPSRPPLLRDKPLDSMAGQELYAPAGSQPIPSVFLHWAQDVKITGMHTSPPQRVIIGNVSYKVGDKVQNQLGVVFDGYDEATHVLRFQNGQGAIICIRH